MLSHEGEHPREELRLRCGVDDPQDFVDRTVAGHDLRPGFVELVPLFGLKVDCEAHAGSFSFSGSDARPGSERRRSAATIRHEVGRWGVRGSGVQSTRGTDDGALTNP
jgi:hypothetical protein